MNERVLLHVRLLVESLAAELAGVGPRVRVDQEVRGQSGRALEALPTDLTAETALLRSKTRRAINNTPTSHQKKTDSTKVHL